MAREATWTSEKGIPVRNLWFLLVHASGLAELLDRTEGGIDGDAEIPELLAVLLATAVERRLRRGLGRGYVERTAALSRVRGRIDWLATETRHQLLCGQITCRYQDLTYDRARNRLARAALRALADRVRASQVRTRLLDLDRNLAAWRVEAHRPTRRELLADWPAAREVEDRLRAESARLALDVVLPSEAEGRTALTRLSHQEPLLRKIFEAGVAGYLRHHLHGRDGWSVRSQVQLKWQAKEASAGLAAILQGMQADVILEKGERRIVVDTKFTSMLVPGRFEREVLKNDHVFQLYAYLRSQEGLTASADRAEGLLLYPSLKEDLLESAEINGHRMTFATIDLSHRKTDLGEQLISVVCA